MALIIPKNNADAQTLDATLRIYYEANDWVQNSVLINKLSTSLDNLGIENEKKEPQSYTKKTQVLAYFGFITWLDVTNSQSPRRITDLGKKFYEARLGKETDKVIAVLIESLNTCTFGRNVIGCDSNSDIEAPNVFIKASLLLKGLSNNEFAYILGRMEFHGEEFHDAVLKIMVNRIKGIKTYPEEKAKKWNDPKPITALKNWGFFNSDDNTISDKVFLKYSENLLQLKTKNNEEVRFVSETIGTDYEDYNPLQQIYFGTPGSGKSWTIKQKYEQDETKVFRTTFHPDTDYASFVGCYKPVKDEEDEKKIVYEFVPQAFTDAYVASWSDLEHPYYLIIEEINRGNCAQIFGDLFQLLDRDKNGYSEYRIKADHDLKDYLVEQLPDDSEGIKDGKLCLPPNLSIIASMNTSDQSLFPMDSAFKRRWSWEYVPIDYENVESSKFEITIGGNPHNWHVFLNAVNKKIKNVTSSEDKQMGNFFIKSSIDEKEFCDKVMFYLWSEVGKDNYNTKDAIFKYYVEDDKQKEFSFNELYDLSKRTKILKGFIRYIEEEK